MTGEWIDRQLQKERQTERWKSPPYEYCLENMKSNNYLTFKENLEREIFIHVYLLINRATTQQNISFFSIRFKLAFSHNILT